MTKLKRFSLYILLLAVMFISASLLFENSPSIIAIDLQDQPVLQTLYIRGETIQIPSIKIEYNDVEYDSKAYVVAPSGRTYLVEEGKFTLQEVGKHIVQYKARAGSKVLTSSVSFISAEKLYSVSDSKSTAIYDSEGEKVDVRLANRATFNFNKAIDISSYAIQDSILSMIVNPEIEGTADAKIFVQLTDAYDSDNYIIIEMRQYLPHSYTTWIVAGSANQVRTGLEYKGETPSSNVVVVNGVEYIKHTGQYGASCRYFSTAGQMPDSEFGVTTKGYIRMDYAKKVLYVGGEGGNTFITDFDNADVYGNNLWTGFTTGKCYVSIYGGAYTASRLNFSLLSVGEFEGSDFAENYIVDSNPPEITVDFGDYSEQTIPKAVVGLPYKIFGATAFDELDKAVDVRVRVFNNFGSANQVEVNVEDGAFVPGYTVNYTIEYSASDSYGNVAQKYINVQAVNDTNLSIELNNDADFKKVGKESKVASANILNANGTPYLSIKAVSKDHEGISYDVVDQRFMPMYSGNYEIIYSYGDYNYDKVHKVEVAISPNDSPEIYADLDSMLPSAFIKNATYNLPVIKAYRFTTGIPEQVNADIYYKNDGGQAVKLDGNSLEVTASGQIEIIYSSSAGSNTVSVSKTVRVIDCGYGGELDLKKYFITDTFEKNGQEAYIEFLTDTSKASGGKASLEYINPLQAFDLSLEYKVNSVADSYNFEKMNVVLYDSQDKRIAVKFSFIFNYSSSLRFSINGGSEYRITYDLSKWNIFNYNNSQLTVSPVGGTDFPVSEDVNGNEFTGFPSGKVYMAVEFENVTGGASLFISKINLQPFNNTVNKDLIRPQIQSEGQVGNRPLNSTFTIEPIVIADVLDPVVSISMWVEFENLDGENSYVVDSRGVTLNITNCSINEIYEFVLSAYGSYTIYYQAVDSSNRKNLLSRTINVYDNVAPVIEFGKMVLKAKVGETVKIADIAVSDNIDAKVDYYLCLITPSYKTISLTNYTEQEGKKVISSYVKEAVLSESGQYRVYVRATDSYGNISVNYYIITVSE